MSPKPIQITNLSVSFPHKMCFEQFNTTIPFGSKIAIIGRNGSGKSTLLKSIAGIEPVTDGSIQLPHGMRISYVPQIIAEHTSLSGGQRFNAALTQAVHTDPDILLLDEPTNHLDQQNRKSLMRMLRSFRGTLMVVSHDPELLRSCIDTLWHIDNGTISVFSGTYDDYVHKKEGERLALEQQLAQLERQKKGTHQQLMKEQQRAAKSKVHGEKKYGNDTIALRAAQGRGERTHNKQRKIIGSSKKEILEQLSTLQLPEIIIPTFHITGGNLSQRTLVSIHDGSVGYDIKKPIVSHLSLIVTGTDRIAVGGGNGSGKTTVIKAILNDPAVIKTGDWHLPAALEIGYLDQHYGTLNPQNTVLETMQQVTPTWTHAEIRTHLNDFLFRKNEEVNTTVQQLSGGEKARLSLALIAAKTPQLLILDEVTNNVDLETRAHIIEVLRTYPGALVVISHDTEFLHAIGIHDYYNVQDGQLLHDDK